MINRWLLFFFLIVGLISCDGGADKIAQTTTQIATQVATQVATQIAEPTMTVTSAPPATMLPTVLPPATNTPRPSSMLSPTLTAVPTNTPRPPTETPFIPTKTAVPTNTPTNTPPTPIPIQPTSPPLLSGNLLPNGSFEEGHYNQYGVPEFQLPNGWRLEWDEGATGYGNESWDVWVRPETRVLPDYQLPPFEHSIFIYDGTHTVKIFKGYGAISIRLLTDVTLPVGTYRMTINMYPDLYTDFVSGQKIWATDPASGEVRFIIGGGSGGTGWLHPIFGQRNTMTHEFTIDQEQNVTIGVGIKAPFAITNNGWVMDAWSLEQIGN